MYFSELLAWELAASITLGLICWQDWQTRSVSWPAFPLLTGFLLACRLVKEPMAAIGAQSVGSLLVLAILLGTLWLYVRLRFCNINLSLADCLGSGDILFWLALTVYFPPSGLLLFLLSSSLVGLLCVVLRLIRPLPGATTLTIPLAGIQAACLLPVLASERLFPALLGKLVIPLNSF